MTNTQTVARGSLSVTYIKACNIYHTYACTHKLQMSLLEPYFDPKLPLDTVRIIYTSRLDNKNANKLPISFSFSGIHVVKNEVKKVNPASEQISAIVSCA